ncbi:preprotein translocase subunit YajC [Actinoallomurus sp. NPDC052274]|uniref:preprotein translocase subunit YajC n=1 Tax=Actinoallomurus sp. NPDC052274 TaxID=3155420 RepID=UPI003436A704
MQGNTTITALTHVVAAKSGSNPLMSLLPLILIVVVFYFLLIRPQRRRQQQQSQLQNQLVPGQRVMTTAGMLATVAAVEDDALVLEIAPGVEARFVKQAIAQVLDDPSDEEEDEESDEAEELAQEHAADEPTADAEAEPEVAQDDIEPKTDAKTVAEDKKPAETLKDGEQKAGKKPSA